MYATLILAALARTVPPLIQALHDPDSEAQEGAFSVLLHLAIIGWWHSRMKGLTSPLLAVLRGYNHATREPASSKQHEPIAHSKETER